AAPGTWRPARGPARGSPPRRGRRAVPSARCGLPAASRGAPRRRRRAAAADRVPRGRSAPRRKQGAGPSSQRLLEDGQRQAAELEGPAMEVTGRGPGGLGLLAQPLPDPLTDLVGRRLPRPAQVAVQLEALLRL